MGDRCYMQITCRRQDRARFEDLGFILEFEESPASSLVVMADDEANYAHCDELPADIPWHGFNGSGGNYGEGKLACDGSWFVEVPATQDGFVVQWNYDAQQPTPESVEEIRQYLEVRAAVGTLFKALSSPVPEKEQV
jgi:hypothetical protein